MNFTIEYFHARVKAEIENWPDDLLAEFARRGGRRGPEWIKWHIN